MRLLLPLLLTMVGCGLFDDGPRERRRTSLDRRMVAPGTPRMAPGAIPEGSPRRTAGQGPTLDQLPEGQPGLVVLVVLDTVRADHLSGCGYERPTSPTLEALVERGAVLSCHAYAPATWTLPSHATFFTGVDVEKHGMVRKGVTLPEDLTTVAEVFADRGYQTLALSANPIVKKTTGLLRGFHRIQVAPGLVSPLLGDGAAKVLRYELAQVDPQRPIFLFVNLFDAHEPYQPIPEGLGWVPSQDAVYFKPADLTDDNPYHRFVTGRMAPDEKAAWLRRITDGYDHAVHLADDALGRLVRVLERHELGKHGVRLVVTSDHGENLGEHGLVRHDGPPWESTARVPFLVWDTTRKDAPIALPDPLPAAVTFHVLTEGTLPAPLPQVRSGSIDYGSQADFRYQDSVAVWPQGRRKLMWRGDDLVAFDVASDPAEEAPKPLTAVERATLEAAVTHWKEAKEASLGRDVDARVIELLQEVGYME